MFLDSQIPCSGLPCLELGKISTITSTEVTGNIEPHISFIYLMFMVRLISWPKSDHKV